MAYLVLLLPLGLLLYLPYVFIASLSRGAIIFNNIVIEDY